MADDFEKRLVALEKRAQNDDERWQAVEADVNGVFHAIESIVAPLIAANRGLAPVIIKNLTTYENESRTLNVHGVIVSRLRRLREFLEERERNAQRPPAIGGGNPSSK